MILCGKTEQIGASVIASLQPEYEGSLAHGLSFLKICLHISPNTHTNLALSLIVVHFVMSPIAGCAEIPVLLSGEPAPSDSALGTRNYVTTPVAVILGGGYNDADTQHMMEAVEQKTTAKQVPWFRPDLSIPTPPLGPEYGRAMVIRLKKAIADIQHRKELGEMKVHWY